MIYLPIDFIEKPQNAVTLDKTDYKMITYWMYRSYDNSCFPDDKLSKTDPVIDENVKDACYRAVYNLKNEIVTKIREEISNKVLTVCALKYPSTEGYGFATVSDAVQVMRRDSFENGFDRPFEIAYGKNTFGPHWEIAAEKEFMVRNKITYRPWKPHDGKKRQPKGFISMMYNQVLNNAVRKNLPFKKRTEATTKADGTRIVRKNKFEHGPVARKTDRVKYVRDKTFILPPSERGITRKTMIDEIQKKFNKGADMSSFNKAVKVINQIYDEKTHTKESKSKKDDNE